MKNLYLLFFFILGIINPSDTYSQTIVDDCDFVTVTSVPNYPSVYVSEGLGTFDRIVVDGTVLCTFTTLDNNVRLMMPLLTLEKQINGNWTAVQGPVEGSVGFKFTNLSPGEYRVKIRTPYFSENRCDVDDIGNINKARIRIVNILGQFIGYSGTYDNSPFGGNPNVVTNEVTVGPSQSSDIQWAYIDGDGMDSGANLYDFNEIVKISTSGTQNQTRWWLAIFELNGAQRYKANGWTTGTIPSEINLTEFWGNWEFENLTSYRVQLAIDNGCNITWAAMSPTPPDFFICPSGSGCRIGDEDVEVTMSPNPTSGHFWLHDLPSADVQVTLYDLSGRLVESFTNTNNGLFDIANVNTGMYIIRASLHGEVLYNNKLSVF